MVGTNAYLLQIGLKIRLPLTVDFMYHSKTNKIGKELIENDLLKLSSIKEK